MRLPTWTPLFLAPIVALLAFIAVTQFSTKADEARQAQIAFSQLEAQAYRMSALDWHAIAARGVEDEMLEERRQIRAQVQDALRSPRTLDTDEGAAVASLIKTYGVALDATLELVSQQRFREAETFDEEVLDPAFAQLSAQLGKANKAEAAEADRASLRARLGTGASIGVATLLLMLLFWRFHHDRRTLLQARADELYQQALHDSLTGLPNRRKLMGDLEETFEEGRLAEPQRFVMFDLDGFKSYNDTFGHPEGDLLLRRLARRFAAAVEGRGTAYRLGGDEFCASIPLTTEADQVIRDCCEALAEEGDAFAVLTSFGTVSIPAEATTPSDALRLADQRMYSSKANGRLSARQQTRDLVLKILAEQQPALRDHVGEVAALARAVGERFDLDQVRLDELERAAELHDVGKLAIPSSILTKTAPLDDEEWRFIRRHTILGETMLRAAPALASTGRLVRSSHERFDGTGYPDALVGEEIPLESRIVFVCDAYQAMTSHDRSYRFPMDKRTALDELRRHSGTQFDPAVVEAFCDELAATKAPRVGPLPAAA